MSQFFDPVFILLVIITIIGIAWLQSSTIYYTSRVVLGEKISPKIALTEGFKKLGTVIVGFILLILFFIPIYLGLVLLIFAGAMAGPMLLFALFFIVFCIVLYLGIKINFFSYAIIVKNLSAIDSFKYSWNLVKGRWWHVFSYILVFGLLSFAMVIIVIVPLLLFMLPEVFANNISTLMSFEYGSASQLVNAILEIVSVYFLIVSTIFFMNLADLKEIENQQSHSGNLKIEETSSEQ